MTAILIYKSGPHQGRNQQIDHEVLRLGRKPDNDIILSEHMVSSHHAEIHSGRGGYKLIDLESTNGTYVNGKRITQTVLQNGDSIEIGEGGPQLEFRTAGERQASQAPRIIPMQGDWDHGRGPLELTRGAFVLGRGHESDIVVGRSRGSVVSGEHAEIRVHSSYCEIEDLGSSNGTRVNSQTIQKTRLRHGDVVELGEGGPVFEFIWDGAPETRGSGGDEGDEDQIFRKLEKAARGGPAGDRTRVFLQAAKKFHKKRRRPLLIISLAAFGIAVVLFVGVVFLWRELERVNNLNRFYETRELRVELVGGRNSLSDEEKVGLRAKRRRLEIEYENYLEKIGWYANRTPQEQATMRLARTLGETDLDIPDGFFEAVMAEVDKWRSTQSLRRSLESAESRGLLRKIRYWLEQKDLPPEFLFIALAESNFDASAVGLETRFGIAKGMWQLIPSTASDFGLEVGPWKDDRRVDPSDHRHDEERATQAAADYLAFLYSTKAAASGLLVMASYNYGQTRIINRLDGLPNDPKERNFWNFYRRNWLPKETRDYVMKIFAAALISLNPELFGYDIKPITSRW